MTEREIRFRAWDTVKKMMVSVYSVEFLQGGTKVSGPGYHYGGPGWAYVNEDYRDRLVTDVVLMQFIGIKDRKGSDLYEGDVIRSVGGHLGEIRWLQESCSFMVRDIKENRYFSLPSGGKLTSSEIIGNIWEHPDLLGGQE